MIPLTYKVASCANGTMTVTIQEWTGETADGMPRQGGVGDRLAVAQWIEDVLNAESAKLAKLRIHRKARRGGKA